jgi:hypothetical protein
MVIYRWILLRMKKALGRNCRENLYTFFVSYIFPWNRVFMRMWKNMVLQDRTRMTIHCSAYALHAAYLNLQAHTECVILINIARLQWLRERAYCYVCVYIACLALPLNTEFPDCEDGGTTLPRGVGNHLPIGTAWHHRGLDIFSHTRCLSSEIR